MADHDRRQSRSVENALYGNASRFTFLQAVRLVEEIETRRRAQHPPKPPCESVHYEDELLFFRHKVRLDMPPSDVESLAPSADSDAPVMTTNILGLAGVLGPLPLSITEELFEEARHNRFAFADFLDIFNHRLIALLFRARKKYRPVLDSRTPANGQVARVLFSLLGLGTRNLRGRVLANRTNDRALLAYTGLFAERHRSAAGLQRVLEDYFGVPARIDTFRGNWDPLDAADQTALGRRNQALGDTAMLGRRVWNQAGRFEVRLGPLDLPRFRSFLPHEHDAFPRLVSLVRFYAHSELAFDVRLVLRREQVPMLCIHSRGGDAYLGRTTWLRRRTPDRDDDKVRLTGTR